MTNKMQIAILGIVLVIACVANGQTKKGPVRLYNNGSTDIKQSSGIVQIYNEGWVNVCFDSDDDDIGLAADVICHQLGFKEASSYSSAGKESYGTDTSPSYISDPDCSSRDLLVIHQCTYEVNTTSCNDSMDLTVNCSTGRLEDDAFDAMVRLVEGSSINEGRVEVFCNEFWGTVCDTASNDSAEFANLICQQLGYTNADTWDEGKIQEANSSQKIWMKDVTCSSDRKYECVAACKTCPIGENNTISSCTHSTDMTVRCVYEDQAVDDTVYNTETCRYANDIAVALAVGILIAVVLFSIFICAICVVLLITIPICICCCLGIGIGASARTKVKKPTNYANFD